MVTKSWNHWTEVRNDNWRWRDFSPEEIACRGDGSLLIDIGAMDALQGLRDRLGAPMIVTSGYRTPAYNREVGGAKRSQHLLGRAFDISMANHDPATFEAAARAAGFTGFGFYPRQDFMHIDTGPAREWGTRWPDAPGGDDASRFTPEPAPRPLKTDGAARGAGIAGAAVAAAQAVEAAKPALAEASGQLQGLAGTLDAAKWALFAIAMLGAGAAIVARWQDGRAE